MNGTTPSIMPLNPIHVALLNNGRLVIVGGSENDPTNKRKVAAVWDRAADPQGSHISVRNLAWDLFCNAMTHKPDGQVAIVGGTARYDPFFGINNTIIYDPVLDIFTQGPSMADARWYPTSTALGNGQTHTISGETNTGAISTRTEILDARGGAWSLPRNLAFTPSEYPRGHLMPNGRIFYSAPDTVSRAVVPSTGQSIIVASHVNNIYRRYGSSVLLPLAAPFDKATVLVMGGHVSTATNSVERITLNAASNFSTGTWTNAAFMAKARVEMNATLLPNGTVLVTGGSLTDNVASTAAKAAELYNPVANTWRTLSSASYPRLYHSVALLMPDATVWTAGSNPARRQYDTHMEVFYPPYLFTTNTAGQVVSAPRPVINSAPAFVGYNSAFTVNSVDSAAITSVAMIRLGAVTHAFDMDQRMVNLGFTKPAAGQLRIQAPPNGNITPPGYYMLFLVNNRGVPSVAKIFHIG